MGRIRVVLHGGPENGSEVNVPADAAGTPTPRFTLPARGHRDQPGQEPPQLVYEREQQSDGTWHFRYVGAEA